MKEINLALTPATRLDVIDVRRRVREEYGDILDPYARALYCSHHTTGGYIDQELAHRLNNSLDSIHTFLRAFQRLFPAGKSYRHDDMASREELTEAEREDEPPNADSHLSFISAGIENCVAYRNDERSQPVYFIDLDGVNTRIRRAAGVPRSSDSTRIGWWTGSASRRRSPTNTSIRSI